MTVRVPAKVNLDLRVGAPRPDGYHPLATVFHAVDLCDEVVVADGAPGSGVSLDVEGHGAADLPRDDGNIAVRAARAAARAAGRDPDLRITIAKSIPVAGGMAGGSADAAAVLVACDALWEGALGRDRLERLAADLGSDVPFLLRGGTMLGTGRGERLAPVLARGRLHWVVALSEGQLSTPAVYAEFDRLTEGAALPAPEVGEAMLQALRADDAGAVGRALHNDLQPAALSLMPSLARTLEAGSDLGALGGIVSGSGPTCIFLARTHEHALDIAVGLTTTGLVRSVRCTSGPVPGAGVVTKGMR